MFSTPSRNVECLDNASLEQQFFYAITNPVEDNLTQTVSQSPFFSTFKHLAFGEPLRFWYIDWQRWWKRGGPRNKNNRIKDFLQWINLEIDWLPAWQNRTEHQYQTRIRKQVQAIEEAQRQQNRAMNQTVIGVASLFAVDPNDRPKNPKSSGPQPLCHTVNATLRREYKKKWREFVSEHRKASQDFRDGYYEREFPLGSYRPPLVTIYTSASL